MEFGDVVALFCMSVLFPAVLFHGIARVRAAKASAGTGTEMRASDLRQMVREAAEEAVAPLSARVASLRARLDPALVADAVESRVVGAYDETGSARALLVRQRAR